MPIEKRPAILIPAIVPRSAAALCVLLGARCCRWRLRRDKSSIPPTYSGGCGERATIQQAREKFTDELGSQEKV